MDRWPGAAARGGAYGFPSASTLREKIFEQDRSGPGVNVARPAELGLARGVALVVTTHRKPELLGRGGEAADAFGLVALLAPQGQRQPDNERIDLLVACDAFDLGEVFDHTPPDERPQRSTETVRVIANGEADAAIADVEREIPQASGRPGRHGRFDFDRDPRIEHGKKRPPRRPRLDAQLLEPPGGGHRTDFVQPPAREGGLHPCG